MCNDLKQIEPVDVAKGIEKALQKLGVISNGRSVGVYIAAPPALHHFRSKIYEEMLTGKDQLKPVRKNLTSFIDEQLIACRQRPNGWIKGNWYRLSRWSS